jgi:hypothetical protein
MCVCVCVWVSELQKIILCLGTRCFVKMCLLTSEAKKSFVSYIKILQYF